MPPISAVLAALTAILPVAAASTGLPYGIVASGSELQIMTRQLRAGAASAGIRLVAQTRVASAVAAAGFDQNSPARACVSARCAKRIGRSLHADFVVFGSAMRPMAVVWSSEFSILDMRSGKVYEKLNLGYKGDVQAMELGERYAGGCIARVILKQKHCPPDREW